MGHRKGDIEYTGFTAGDETNPYGLIVLKEEKFRQLVEKVQDIIFITDYLGNFLYMNPFGFRLLGYTAEELYKKNYCEIFPEEFKNMGLEFYSTQLKDRLERTYHEIPIICKDGKVLWFGQNVIRVEESGQVYFYGLARDITDRLKVEDALRESEEKYRTILESMEEGYFEVDLKGNLTFFNKFLCEMISHSTADQLMHVNYRKFMDEKNARHVFQEYNQVYQTGVSRLVKYSIINERNEERKLEALISPVRDYKDTITGFRGLARDITDKERMLEHLKQSLAQTELSEKKYRLLAENSTDIIWVLDRDTFKFSYISPSVEKVRGLTVEEAQNESLEDVFPQEDMLKVLNVFSDELEKDKSGLYDPDRRITFETRQYKKDGTMIWVEITTKFIRDETGEAVAAQGSTRDISHRKFVEQERDRYAENLAAARIVQQEILPQRVPSSELVDVAFRYLPMEAVGGDYFTFVDFREYNNLGVFIGDVSGHGVPAALYTMMLKAITDRLFRKYNLEPSRFLEELNNETYMYITSHFITGIYGLFSAGEKAGCVNFSFSKGGHPYPVHYSKQSGKAEYIESTGRALGFLKNQQYQTCRLNLDKGDRIYFYTDGLIEVFNSDREIFGFNRFLDLINETESKGLVLEESLDFILKTVIDYSAHYEQDDDIVIIGIEAK